MDYNDALLIANGLLVIITAALVFVTWSYTSHTKKMADIMMKDYALRIKPFFVIELQSGIYTEDDFKRAIIIKNMGLNEIYTNNVSTYITIPDKLGQPMRYNISVNSTLDKLEPSHTKSYEAYIDFKELNKLQIENLFTDNNPNRTKDMLESKNIKVGASPNLKYPSFDVFVNLDIAGPDLNFETYTEHVL